MGEGEPAPAAPENLGPPEYVIKIFISGNSGSKEITNNQHRIIMILKSLGIKMEAVDISGKTITINFWTKVNNLIANIANTAIHYDFLQPLEWMIRET